LLQSNLLHLPFQSSSFDAGLDRGCSITSRQSAARAHRRSSVVYCNLGGKLLMRASLRAAEVGNDIDEEVIFALLLPGE